jgi:peptidoglycan/LPS O-acetylase OafA/YrhL
MKNQRLFIILAAITVVLLIPFIAMQFTNEVDWSLFDFIIMGVLLYGTGLLCELVMRKVKNIRNRILICAALVFAFLLIWAELAVGIFGSPFAGS